MKSGMVRPEVAVWPAWPSSQEQPDRCRCAVVMPKSASGLAPVLPPLGLPPSALPPEPPKLVAYPPEPPELVVEMRRVVGEMARNYGL